MNKKRYAVLLHIINKLVFLYVTHQTSLEKAKNQASGALMSKIEGIGRSDIRIDDAIELGDSTHITASHVIGEKPVLRLFKATSNDDAIDQLREDPELSTALERGQLWIDYVSDFSAIRHADDNLIEENVMLPTFGG